MCCNNMIRLCWVFVLAVIIPLSYAQPQKCDQRERSLAGLEHAEYALNRAKDLYPNCEEETDISNSTECSKKDKSLGFIDVALYLISNSKINISFCPHVPKEEELFKLQLTKEPLFMMKEPPHQVTPEDNLQSMLAVGHVMTEECLSNVTTEEQLTNFTTEEPLTNITTEEPLTNVTTEEILLNVTTEEYLITEKTEEPLTTATTVELLTYVTTEEPLTSGTTEEILLNVTTEEHLTTETTVEPLKIFTTEELLTNVLTERTLTSVTTEEPLNNITTEEPLGNATKEEPWTNVTTEEPTLDTTTESIRPMDCQELHAAGVVTCGVYTVWPLGGLAVRVRCDMHTDGGGWTVIQRRGNFWKQENFNRDWQHYKNGFGSLERDFWLGNDFIFSLSNQGAYSLRMDMTAADGESAYALYREFRIEDESANYKLHVGGYEGTAGDMMTANLNNQVFSTKDRNNGRYWFGRPSPWNCAVVRKSGFWFRYTCGLGNPNGLYIPGKWALNCLNYYTFKKYVCLFSMEMKMKRL